MNQPSLLSDVLTKLDTLADSVASLHESVAALQPLHGSVASLTESVAALQPLHGSVASLTESVAALQPMHGSVASLTESVASLNASMASLDHRLTSLEDTVTTGFGAMGTRFERVDRTLDEHGVALLELTTDVRRVSVIVSEHSSTLRHHSGALHRIEQRQRAETRAVDDHERRINVLERRR